MFRFFAELLENSEQTKLHAEETLKYTRQCAELLAELKQQNRLAEKNASERDLKERYDRYWMIHASERPELFEELVQIEREMDEIRLQSDPIIRKIEAEKDREAEPVPAVEESRAVLAQYDELKAKKRSVSPFNRDERAAIQEQIDACEEECSRLLNQIDLQRAELEEEIDRNTRALGEELKPLSDRLRELKQRKAEIESELSRER